MSETETDPSRVSPVIVLVRDLLFFSKIRAAAQAAGVALQAIRDPWQLATAVSDVLIVDLNQEGALSATEVWLTACAGRRTAIGFASHVDTQTITAARKAGIRVLVRSQFEKELHALLLELNSLSSLRAP